MSADDTRPPIVLVAPAMAIGSGYYRPLVEAFDEIGWAARALPRQGFEPGQPRADRRHDWSYDDEIDAMEQAVLRARDGDGDRPVILLGHSLGGQLAGGYGLTGRPPVDGFVTVGGALPHYVHFRGGGYHVAVMGGLIVPVLTTVFGYLPKPAFGGPGARTLMREWGRMAVTGRPPYDGPPITTPSLIVSLDGDRLAPRSAVDGFARDLFEPGAVTRWHHASRAPGVSIEHIGWVRTPGPVVERVRAWWNDL